MAQIEKRSEEVYKKRFELLIKQGTLHTTSWQGTVPRIREHDSSLITLFNRFRRK